MFNDPTDEKETVHREPAAKETKPTIEVQSREEETGKAPEKSGDSKIKTGI